MTDNDENNDKRQKLISAATELFINYAYEKVSIRTIADKANVNSAMISYYFGSKAGLFNEVINEMFWLKKKQMQPASDLRSWLKDSLRNFFKFMSDNPGHKRIIQSALSSKDEEIRYFFIDYFLGRNLSLFKLMISKSEATNLQINTDSVWFVVTSITLFPLLHGDIFSRLKSTELDKFLEQYSIDAADLLIQGLKARK